jgi:hypothetical protein
MSAFDPFWTLAQPMAAAVNSFFDACRRVLGSTPRHVFVMGDLGPRSSPLAGRAGKPKTANRARSDRDASRRGLERRSIWAPGQVREGQIGAEFPTGTAGWRLTVGSSGRLLGW